MFPNAVENFPSAVVLLPNAREDVPFAIELRAPEWFQSDALQNEWQALFAENNITPVLTDTPGRRDVLSFKLTNENLFIRYVGDFSNPLDQKRVDQWVNRIIELVDLGVKNVWFYAHQPGEKRALVIEFFNYLLERINYELNLSINKLINYES